MPTAESKEDETMATKKQIEQEAADAWDEICALCDTLDSLRHKAAAALVSRLENEYRGVIITGESDWSMARACDLGRGLRLYLHIMHGVPFTDDKDLG